MKIISATIGLTGAFAPPQPDLAVVVDANRIVATGTRAELKAAFQQAGRRA